MTEENSNNSKPNNRPKKRYNKNKKRSPTKPNSSEKGTKSADGAKASSANKRPSNKNRRPKTLTPARVLQKYDNLLEQHLIARKKYSEVHGRLAGRQLEKVVANLEKSRKNLHNYESTLQLDWQKEVIAKRLNLYPEDRQFSSTHELEPVGDEVSFEGDFEDPHLLPIQRETSWADDTEESSGTTEDYEKYKQTV
jgi:hypothetical protein